MHRAATKLRSPPKFCVAGVARARVRLREGNDKARVGEMPITWHTAGYTKREKIEMLIVGTKIGRNYT
jgi:hypothetical protein